MVRFRMQIDEGELASFCAENRIRRLALFGSVLRDDFRPDSDVDVLVEFEPDHRIGYGFITLQDELAAMFGRPVDLNTPQDLSRYFRQDVIASSEVLFDAEAARAI